MGDIDNPLISLNGADNIIIDGRVNGTGSDIDLSIINTSQGASASTIRFLNSAENNIIKYCIIKGSGTGPTRGIILFAGSSSGPGNDHNSIENNNITGNLTFRPVNGIYSSGTIGRDNSGISIMDNKFYDIFNYGLASNGVLIVGYSSGWTISGNSFYETALFVPTAQAIYYSIRINSTPGLGFSVINNYIGGTSPLCGGSPWTKTSSFNNTYYGISLSVGTGTRSSVQNNIISNMNWSNASNCQLDRDTSDWRRCE